MFLFVVRPFDVGDAVLLGPAQDWCNVRAMLSQCCRVTSDEIVKEGAACSSKLFIAAKAFSSPAPFVCLLSLPGIPSEWLSSGNPAGGLRKRLCAGRGDHVDEYHIHSLGWAQDPVPQQQALYRPLHQCHALTEKGGVLQGKPRQIPPCPCQFTLECILSMISLEAGCQNCYKNAQQPQALKNLPSCRHHHAERGQAGMQYL